MRRSTYYHRLVLLLICTGISAVANAHTINYELAKLSATGTAWRYVELGFLHILPMGLDHILFVLSLFLLSPKLSTVIWQATAFTVAHSITLGLAMYGAIEPLPAVIEPIIALSIFFVAIENMLIRELKPGRIAVIFAFGLIHGMGFAGALKEVGLPPQDYLVSLVSFNVGVELGQLTVVLAAWLLVGKWFSEKNWYRKVIVNPASAFIAFVALFWTVQRTFF